MAQLCLPSVLPPKVSHSPFFILPSPISPEIMPFQILHLINSAYWRWAMIGTVLWRLKLQNLNLVLENQSLSSF